MADRAGGNGELGDRFFFWFSVNGSSGAVDPTGQHKIRVRKGGLAADQLTDITFSATILTSVDIADGSMEAMVDTGDPAHAAFYATGGAYGVFCNEIINGVLYGACIGSFTLAPVLTGNSGTGANAIYISVVNDSAVALQNASVRLSSNSGVTYAEGALTDAGGASSVSVNNGQWLVSAICAGHQMTEARLTSTNDTDNPVTISGNDTITVTMTAVTFSASPPGMTTGYTYAYDDEGEPEQGAIHYLQLVAYPTTTGITYDNKMRSATSDATGLVEFIGLQAGCTYRLRRGKSGSSSDTTISANPGATTPLAPISGHEI